MIWYRSVQVVGAGIAQTVKGSATCPALAGLGNNRSRARPEENTREPAEGCADFVPMGCIRIPIQGNVFGRNT